tara:strand:+ start:158 stop:727 length:570 start_codon:yes stop_codon:yes gene_type:complete
MDGSAARHRAISAIRARVLATGTGSWFADAEHVQLAVASAARSADELTAVLFNENVRRAVRGRASAIAITGDEWRALFGVEARPWKQVGLARCAGQAGCVEMLERLQRALRCTVAETNEAKAWSSTWSRLAVYVALHLSDTEAHIASTLGNFVGGDSRRVEELAVSIEDCGIDALTLTAAIDCLSKTVA